MLCTRTYKRSAKGFFFSFERVSITCTEEFFPYFSVWSYRFGGVLLYMFPCDCTQRTVMCASETEMADKNPTRDRKIINAHTMPLLYCAGPTRLIEILILSLCDIFFFRKKRGKKSCNNGKWLIKTKYAANGAALVAFFPMCVRVCIYVLTRLFYFSVIWKYKIKHCTHTIRRFTVNEGHTAIVVVVACFFWKKSPWNRLFLNERVETLRKKSKNSLIQ